jgi:DNA (cytosine-5)-methyltransferase 1
MLRVIREVQPTWVVGENVPGLVNWSNGVVFEEVQSDLEAEGYEVQSFILPAAGVGAPHRRDRVWIVAYSDRYGRSRIENEKYSTERRQPSQCRVGQCDEDGAASNTKGEQGKRMQPEQRELSEQGQREFGGINSTMGCGHASNPSGTGQQKQNIPTEPTKQEFSTRGDNAPGADWKNFPTQSPICNGNDGIFAGLVRYILRNGGDCYTEEEAEKEAKRIISKVRTEGIKAGGNAIVHQVALQIFKSINEFEKTL